MAATHAILFQGSPLARLRLAMGCGESLRATDGRNASRRTSRASRFPAISRPWPRGGAG